MMELASFLIGIVIGMLIGWSLKADSVREELLKAISDGSIEIKENNHE